MKALRAVLAAALFAAVSCFAQVGGPLMGQAVGGSNPVFTGTASFTGVAGFADGAVGAPSVVFTSDPTTGWYFRAANGWTFTNAGAGRFEFLATQFIARSDSTLCWSSGALGAAVDLCTARDAANTFAQKNGTAAQVHRLYFTTTGPVYYQQTARTHGVLLTGSGGAMQLSTAQTTVPTCTTNCGTSPSIVGTDTAMRVTMGATGVPASAWVVQFNGTWPAAPVCHVTAALASMVVGKQAIAVVVTTTTITVTTNGTAPANADQYQIICMGVS